MANQQIVRQQKPELEIVVHLGQNPIPVIDGIVGVDVVIEINPVIPTGDSPPLDLCIVVDCSGSMGERASRHTRVRKIEAVRTALENIVRKMSQRDRIRVIGFSMTAFEILPWTLIETADITKVVQTLQEGLVTDKSTYFAEALKMVFDDELGTCGLPNVVLFTDGQSTDRNTDHPCMIAFVDILRERKIPLIIYGTGPDYEWSLLQQLAIRAGNGSLLYHVLSAEDLEAHLTGELAFRHGSCLQDMTISLFSKHARVRDVYRFVPQEQAIHPRDPNSEEYRDGGSYVYAAKNGFIHPCGTLDHMRGQRFLFHIEVPLDFFLTNDCLFTLLTGSDKTVENLGLHTLCIEATCTRETPIPKINPEVDRYLKMVEATKAIKAGDIARGAAIYTDLGQDDIAQTLIQIIQAGEDDASTTRSTQSVAASATSTVFTAGMMQKLREQLEKKP